jgi:hypothetical protein
LKFGNAISWATVKTVKQMRDASVLVFCRSSRDRTPKKRKTELQTRERRQSGLNLTIIRLKEPDKPRKALSELPKRPADQRRASWEQLLHGGKHREQRPR